MNKKLLFSFLCLLFNPALFSEGFVSSTLVAISPGALQPMNKFCAGFDAYSLNEQGEMALARIVEMKKTEQYKYKIMQLEGGTEICGDWDQLFYCPNRNAWLKFVDLNAGEDSVYSYKQKKPLRILSIKTFNTAFFNLKVSIHRISLDKYGVYFVSKDLILVHNFAVILPTLGAILFAHAAEVVVAAAGAVASAYVTEKICEKLGPTVRDLMRSSPKTGDAGTPASPNVDTNNKGSATPETPPPGGGGLDPFKVPPTIAAEEQIRKNGEPAAKAVGNAVQNAVNKIFNHDFLYHPRIRQRALQDPKAHNFPYSFDDQILMSTPRVQQDGSLLFVKEGVLNNTKGFFEIALNPETKTIFHRTFVSG